MRDRNQVHAPYHWRENAPPPTYPEEPWDSPREYVRVGQSRQHLSWREWLATLSPVQQVGYGCILVMILSATMVYCVGTATFFVRPMLVERAAITPTEVTRPTLVPTPTQVVEPTTYIQVPKGPLVATPTQAPIPPRDSILVSPPQDVLDRLTQTPQATSGPGPSPTRKPGGTATPTTKP